MANDKLATTREGQIQDMKAYYAFQAKIYDATRWTFLFGRNSILKKIPLATDAPLQILEVGCGTGSNLYKLAEIFPNAHLVGMDVSGDMITVATKKLEKFGDRIELHEKPYEANTEFNGRFDVILFSYALTMINPQWQDILEQAPHDLKPNGLVAVVDFHRANYEFYRKFMRGNHVRLDGHILPVLVEKFTPLVCKVNSGLAGVWEYMMFVGRVK